MTVSLHNLYYVINIFIPTKMKTGPLKDHVYYVILPIAHMPSLQEGSLLTLSLSGELEITRPPWELFVV